MRANNKFSKYRFLKRSKKLARYLPDTQRLTRSAFRTFLIKYGQVILKPVIGSGGNGVMKVSALGNHRYEVHRENRKTMIKSKKRTYDYVKRIISSSPYMVQRRIRLATVNSRPFDMRIVVQRRRNSNLWSITAKAAKVAGKGYIVTNNTRSKGKMLHVETALQRSSLKGHSRHALLSKINRVALRSAKRLRVAFPTHRTYGIDMGVDQIGRLWIIETNHYPAISHFRKLGDKAMIRRYREYRYG